MDEFDVDLDALFANADWDSVKKPRRTLSKKTKTTLVVLGGAAALQAASYFGLAQFVNRDRTDQNENPTE